MKTVVVIIVASGYGYSWIYIMQNTMVRGGGLNTKKNWNVDLGLCKKFCLGPFILKYLSIKVGIILSNITNNDRSYLNLNPVMWIRINFIRIQIQF